MLTTSMSESSSPPGASLASLPTEIADAIYHSLTPGTLARLARVSKSIYAAVQGPLYRRPVINSFRKLQLFVQTLNKVASWDKTGDARSKWIVHLTLLIDPAVEEITNGRPLIAVLLARLINVIVRYNPAVTISMIISHSSCQSQPVRSFQSERFPRVTNLILDLSGDAPARSSRGGSSSMDTVIPRRRHIAAGYSYGTSGGTCVPNTAFWTRFFNGQCFPDLQKLELHHRSRRHPSNAYGFGREAILFTEMDTVGLAKIERLVMNSVPEFNDAVLMAGLQHAPLLTDLHIEDCSVSYEALDKLLLHALPVLERLVLRVSPKSEHAEIVRHQMNIRKPPVNNPHLCPHFRRSGRNLKHCEFSAPYICRDIFVDGYEVMKLSEAGHPGVLEGDPTGEIVSGYLDAVLVTTTINRLRQSRETDSGPPRTATDGKTAEEDAASIDKERALRTRRAKIERERWTRKLHVLRGICVEGDTFKELVVLAETEEPGVTWTVGHRPSGAAVKVVNGMTRDVRHQDEFVAQATPREQHRQRREFDFNDGLMGADDDADGEEVADDDGHDNDDGDVLDSSEF
ncbi:hypothetical protein TWF696_004225 [Orbilia brochopaga]|uniref:F-box domain-containing protein n=1 Tax=Orbilia brochopaga TaxID=3140254 RepID=A0AAV9V5K8_9PEZI